MNLKYLVLSLLPVFFNNDDSEKYIYYQLAALEIVIKRSIAHER